MIWNATKAQNDSWAYLKDFYRVIYVDKLAECVEEELLGGIVVVRHVQEVGVLVGSIDPGHVQLPVFPETATVFRAGALPNLTRNFFGGGQMH